MRICPECDLRTAAEVCPNDGRGTIPESLLSGPQRIEKFVGTTLDNKFQILERLGAGGYATVYRAKHVQMGGDVAVKIMEAGNVADPVAIKRFYLEAQNTHKLRHPNTVRVMDFGQTPTGDLYLAMEYLPGVNVKDAVKEEGRLAASRVVRVLSQVFKSLGEAHDQGLVHRDIKADNVMLVEQFGEKDFVKVLDFGISRQTASAHLTHASGTIGTPRNMAPEQWRGEAVDARTDLYAVGCMAYFMLTGEYPFKFGREVSGTTEVVAYMNAHLSDYPEPINKRAPGAVTAPLGAFIDRLLAKERDDRPTSALAALAELEAAAAKEPLPTTVPEDSSAVPLNPTYIMPGVSAPGAGDFEAAPEEATRMLQALTVPGPPSPPPEQTRVLDVSDVRAGHARHGDGGEDEVDIGATQAMPVELIANGPSESSAPAYKTHAVSTDVVRKASGDSKSTGKSKTPLYLLAAAAVAAIVVAVVLSSSGDETPPPGTEVVHAAGNSPKTATVAPATASTVPVEPTKPATAADASPAIQDSGTVREPPETTEPDVSEAAADNGPSAVDAGPSVAEPPTPVAPVPVKVALSSTPPGLDVVLSLTGAKLGVTPFTWTMSETERATLDKSDLALSFEHADGRRIAGFLKKEAIREGQATVDVVLAKAPAAVTKKSATKKTTKKAAKKKTATKKKTTSKKKKGGAGWGF